MKRALSFTLLVFTVIKVSVVYAEPSDESVVLEIDAAWERAFLHCDLSFFEETLLDNFVWVHDHVSNLQEGKEVILAMVARKKERESGLASDEHGSRTQRDVKVILSGDTAVTYGYLTKVQSKEWMSRHVGESNTIVYHFMRTYSKVRGEWMLLSNHTMEVPKK